MYFPTRLKKDATWVQSVIIRDDWHGLTCAMFWKKASDKVINLIP